MPMLYGLDPLPFLGFTGMFGSISWISGAPLCTLRRMLGDFQHAGLDVVYENVPNSLRDIEETTGFQT